jgi:hypothetical protein
MSQLFWLSFVHIDRAIGDRCVGACVVEADDFVGAIEEAWRLGINPGGEVAGLPIPADKYSKFPESMRTRLLTRDEAKAIQ